VTEAKKPRERKRTPAAILKTIDWGIQANNLGGIAG